jgi:hypothetical protein
MKIEVRDVPPRAAWALEQTGVHPLLARLYAARGVTSAAELDDGLARLLPPADLKGAQAAAVLLADVIAAGKRLCIVADYDCDGATACAVGLRGLRLLGARHVDYLVPDRVVDGYGLTPPIAERVAARGADLLITVDNGIASVEGVARARQLGLQVLVTDLPAAAPPGGERPLQPGEAGSCRGAAASRRHRQPQPAWLRLCQQGAGRRRRDVLRAAGPARRAAPARCVLGNPPTQARFVTSPGRPGHRRRRGAAGRQQPPPGRPGPGAHPRRAVAGRPGRSVFNSWPRSTQGHDL